MTVETIVACLWCCIIAQLMISALKQCLVRLYLHLLVGGLLFYLQYLCFLRIVVSSTYCGVQHVLWCPTRLVLCFLFCFSSYSMLPVTLDCPIWIAHSVFYYIYLQFCYFYHKLIVKVTIKLCYCISEYSTI
jgi:hypothetical protein